MSLTLGSIAPFGRPTGGHANIDVPTQPAHLLYLHLLPQRIRGEVAGTLIAQTSSARMLHETRMLPKWYLPREDVVFEVLEASDTTTHCPFKGDARYWNVRIGDRLITDAFWEYPEPLADAPPLAGLMAPDLAKLESWWEEDDQVIGHPKDPFHRVDLRRSSRRVTISVAGSVIGTTSRPLAVDETGFPTQWYVPIADLDEALLTPSNTETVCPYKGRARYWAVHTAGEVMADGAWGYPTPVEGMERLSDYVAFAASDKVTVTTS